MIVRPLILLLIVMSHPGWAQGVMGEPCRAAIAATERATGVPDRLMQAISEIESGRRNTAGKIVAWPWTINVEGIGEVFDTKSEVIAAVAAHRARGARSIDVGCMQVSLMHHPDAFATLDEAFDPVVNARYAARFLQQLLSQTGSWPRAVAGYHSLTPDIGGDYARKVMAIWARPELGPGSSRLVIADEPMPTGAAISGRGLVAAPYAALPSASLAHAPTTSSSGPTFTKRGLDSYRAMPTRMAAINLPRRS